MMKNLKLWSGTLGIVFLLASCASTAHIEKDDNADFSRYKTFAWVDKDGEGSKDMNRSNDLTEQKIKAAVTKELEKTAGWRESKNRPDVLLSYDVLIERNIKESSSPVYSRPFTRMVYNPYTRRYATIYYPSEFMGYDRDQRAVREGTVTISMIDAKTDRAVWTGWTTDEVGSRNLSSKEINNAVRSIFKKFDVAKN
jgi:basic membrane lipoprotein Med (substrate-binding protein (PBP1-ABC) superfamily)